MQRCGLRVPNRTRRRRVHEVRSASGESFVTRRQALNPLHAWARAKKIEEIAERLADAPIHVVDATDLASKGAHMRATDADPARDLFLLALMRDNLECIRASANPLDRLRRLTVRAGLRLVPNDEDARFACTPRRGARAVVAWLRLRETPDGGDLLQHSSTRPTDAALRRKVTAIRVLEHRNKTDNDD